MNIYYTICGIMLSILSIIFIIECILYIAHLHRHILWFNKYLKKK